MDRTTRHQQVHDAVNWTSSLGRIAIHKSMDDAPPLPKRHLFDAMDITNTFVPNTLRKDKPLLNNACAHVPCFFAVPSRQALQLAKRSWLLYLMAGLNAASIWTTQITQTSSHAHVIGASVDTCKSAKLFSDVFSTFQRKCTLHQHVKFQNLPLAAPLPVLLMHFRWHRG